MIESGLWDPLLTKGKPVTRNRINAEMSQTAGKKINYFIAFKEGG